MSKIAALIAEAQNNGTALDVIVKEQQKIIDRLEKRVETLQNHKKQAPFDTAFKGLIAQFASVLDGDDAGYILGSVADGAGDGISGEKPDGIDSVETHDPRTHDTGDNVAGFTRPSTQDKGLEIVLSMLTQTMHNQLHGRDGKNSAIEFLTNYRSRATTPQFQQRWANKSLTGDDMKLLRQLDIQQSRVTMLQMLMDTFQSTYEAVTRKKWQPYSATAVNAVGESAKVFSDADIARLLGVNAPNS